MLQIKTITEDKPFLFDEAVNKAMEEGWELVRRECFITGSDRATTFYAELERIIEESEEDPEEEMICAEWKISRDPAYPYKCSSCGCKIQEPLKNCPHCHKIMLGPEN